MMQPREIVTTSIFMLIITIGAYATTRAGLNFKQFGILCDIYNVAANTPAALYDAAELEKIQNEIDVINASLSDDEGFLKERGQQDDGQGSKRQQPQNAATTSEVERWKAAVGQVNAEGQIIKLPSSHPAVSAARERLARLEKKVVTIRRSIREKELGADLGQMREKFEAAIGSCTAAKCDIAANTHRNTCGQSSGKVNAGSNAGKTLIGDFLCLCAAQATDDGACGSTTACGKECIPDPPDTASASWGTTSVAKVETIWEKLKAGCEKRKLTGPASARQGKTAIAAFLRQIANAPAGTTTTVVPGLFGSCGVTCVNADCDGTYTTNKGICVFYGDATKNWESSITWLQNMEAGLKFLEVVENRSASIQHDVTQIKVLHHRAEEIYEETKAATELERENFSKPTQNQSQKQNPTNPTDKTTAHEPTAVSTAPIPRFILPWTLLI